ncbi:MAG: hypothetical protein ACLGI8_09750 [Acidimicrobiia bacterium]
MTAGALRAQRTLAALALALGWLAAGPADVAGAEDPPATTSTTDPCALDPIPVGCEDPPPDSTTTTVAETTTTGAPVVTAAPSTTTTRPSSRPTTTTIVEVEITTTTLGLTTSTDLLVPGDGTEGAESTTTTEATVAISNEGSGPSDGTLIGIVVAGLVLIAVVVSILTWRYWVATRPVPVEGEGRPVPAG